jgi:hypothetical protein
MTTSTINSHRQVMIKAQQRLSSAVEADLGPLDKELGPGKLLVAVSAAADIAAAAVEVGTLVVLVAGIGRVGGLGYTGLEDN